MKPMKPIKLTREPSAISAQSAEKGDHPMKPMKPIKLTRKPSAISAQSADPRPMQKHHKVVAVTEQQQTITLPIKGMTCASCVSHVQRALDKIPSRMPRMDK